MARAYYSTVFEKSADDIWSVIRDFNNYAVWVEGVGESFIEDGKTGDTVGAVRNVSIGERKIRQRLLALSDRDRFQTYEFGDSIPYPLYSYEATLRVTPITDGNRAFVEWWATFDCEASEYGHWATFFANSFAGWLGSLRAYLAK